MADLLMDWIETTLAECPQYAFEARLREGLERRISEMPRPGMREGFTTITPYVIAVEIDRAIAFAKEAFGAVETDRVSSPGGIHSKLQIGDSMLMFGGGPTLREPEKLNALHIQVPDTDAVYQRALAAGGESLFAPSDKPYGARDAGVRDPVGNSWFIATLKNPDQSLRTVTPYLLADKDPLGLIDFLKTAFGAQEIAVYKSPQGKLMHAALRIGDATLEMGEAPGMPFAFYLYVPDADAVYHQAVTAGAKSLDAPADQRWGDRMGVVEDPWGNTWYIASHAGTQRR